MFSLGVECFHDARDRFRAFFSLGFVSISKMLHYVGEENPPRGRISP